MITIDNYSIKKRKDEGIFYTPKFLAEYLSKKVIQYFGTDRKISSVIDPACGDGELIRNFISEYNNQHDRFESQIVGVDKDKNAILNSEVKLKKIGLRTEYFLINTDALFPFDLKISAQGWQKLKKETKNKTGFDIFLSNPPWGTDMTGYSQHELNSNFNLAKGQFDIFDLFFEVIYNNLKKNGIYGLILPDSIFNIEHAGLRKVLAENTSIHLIARLGEKIFPEINRACVVIVGEKKTPETSHLIDCFRLTAEYKRKVISNDISLEKAENEMSYKISQERFLKNKNYLFDIDLKVEEQNLMSKIEYGHIPLKDLLESKRGAEISKKGNICQCPACKLWMPYPKLKIAKCNHCKATFDINTAVTDNIVDVKSGYGKVNIKVGEDLFRFTSRSKSYIDISKEGINYKNLEIYKGDKILVRKTGIGITASIDYENSITTQVVYILKLKRKFEKKISLEFILAFLNSRVMTYYLIKKYGENEWRTHPYMTQTALMNLPLPEIDFDNTKISSQINIVTQIINEEARYSKEKNISKKSDLMVERMVANFFSLNEEDYNIIIETLRNSEQLIPIKRLLNCSSKEIFS
ncbi:N-6 DNA methylase [Elizabethkingia anophelis]|uniref:N-6 DNA methylase n=1 Tax=Elizabethkingia anophelis TaxID=1117645 RepID=UPI00063AF303|nr:N-6 DNA methylase [Elizabethkingia anophelis]AKH95423.1 hypothetical protein M876_12685 [Elizabethkingia anophelis FMS-007]